jgi:hypothetical protein
MRACWMRESAAVPSLLSFSNGEKGMATYTPFSGLFSLMSLLFRSHHGAPSPFGIASCYSCSACLSIRPDTTVIGHNQRG